VKHQAIWHRQAVRSRRPLVRRVTAGGIVAAAALAVPALATGPATASHAPGGARGAATAAVSGTLRAWGLGGNGQLGNGTTQTSTVPIKVKLPAGTKVTSVRAGCFHSLALTSTGQVLAWGFNAVGQLGNGSTTDSDTPVPVSVAAGITVAGIAAGDLHSLALTSTGQVWAWGFGLQGELGNGATNSSDTPVMVTLRREPRCGTFPPAASTASP
jgi:alpha-tubulin suppressor-like RCC1 family protein